MTRTKALIAIFCLPALCAGAADAQPGNWYWRLDTGYAWGLDADIKDKDPGNFVTGSYICGGGLIGCNAPPGTLNNIGEAWIVGGGIGYRFTPVSRADVTFGYRSGFKLDDADTTPSTFTADITSFNLILNGYVDFPNARMGSAVPYVGAGIGYARNKIGDITNYNLPPLPPGVSTLPGGTKSGVAWQISAGFGIALARGNVLDLGYRYLDSGKIETGSGNVTGFFAGPYTGFTGKLRSHELQLGVRF
jgi:opacity protein-like surface antigen